MTSAIEDSAAAGPRAALTTADLARWCALAQTATAANRQHLDEINLLFDPDEDTGTNLTEMWSSLHVATELVVRKSPGLVTPAALLVLWGEDNDYDIVGRSTRIMKRVFRAMASAAHGAPVLTSSRFSDVLAAAANISIRDWDELLPEAGDQPGGPQPGTILDVVEAAADAANSARRAGLDAQLLRVAAAAKRATEATSRHHQILRATGLVDAGALGLAVALQELPEVLRGARQ